MSEEDRWLRFLSRSCSITAILGLALLVAYVVAIAFDVPMDRGELVGAARRPFAHRVDASLDSAVWLGICVVLIAFARLLWTRAPIRATLIAACAAGQLLGSAGGFIRFNVVQDLASQYTQASPVQQTEVVATYGYLANLFGSMFSIGALLYGLAFVLFASASVWWSSWPRWLVVWIGLSGAYPIMQRLLAIGGIDLQSAFIGYFLFGQIALYAAIAIVFWRPVHGREAGINSAPSPV